eukprot:c37523_g1_i1 orf=72-242(-)
MASGHLGHSSNNNAVTKLCHQLDFQCQPILPLTAMSIDCSFTYSPLMLLLFKETER